MKKKIFITKKKLYEILKKYNTPFHLYDEYGIETNIKNIYKAFSWNNGFKEYFAIKANSNPFLINILLKYNCGCDCSSYTELMLAEALGCKNIMFSSNNTPANDYIYANKLNAIINLDDFTHINFLEKSIGYIPKCISCRYNPGGTFKISNNIMDNPKNAKYGMTKTQIFEAFNILKRKGVKIFGIHAFLASNVISNDYYKILSKKLFKLAVELKKYTKISVKFINLSGGIGIPYKPNIKQNDIYKISDGVRKNYNNILIPFGMKNISIYCEMGRFVLGPFGCLVTKVIHKKHIYKEYIGVDACSVDLIRPAMYGAYHYISVVGKENNLCDHKYDVVGSLCENNDKFAINRMLPKIKLNDILIIHDTGAHGYSMGYNYNGKLKSAEILLKKNRNIKLIRRPETPKDYFATLDCFDIYNSLNFNNK